MKSLHLILTSTLLFAPLLSACSDDGETGSSSSESSSESGTTGESDTAEEDSAEGDSASASGDGDGDDPATGDGDGDEPTTTGDGDGDEPTTTGDGDGDEPTSGDGDGDEPTSGDGDGDDVPGECIPADDSECEACRAEECCDELMLCKMDEGCSCFYDCLSEGGNGMACVQECGIDNPMEVPGFAELRACTMESCGDFCQMGGGGGNMP